MVSSSTEIKVKLVLDVDEKTRAALISLGWTPPEGDGPRCRYCGADCSNGRSWDGDGLYACSVCAEDRAARRGAFAPGGRHEYRRATGTT